MVLWFTNHSLSLIILTYLIRTMTLALIVKKSSFCYFFNANAVRIKLDLVVTKAKLSNSYTMGCPPVRGDNPRALASGLSYVQVDKHGITILYHLHQCRPCTSPVISC